MDNANPPLLRQSNGKARFSNGVHGSGNQGNIERNAPRQTGFQTDVSGYHLGISGNE